MRIKTFFLFFSVSAIGAWGPWSSLSPCSVTCGGGTRTRSRSCSKEDPSSEHDGRDNSGLQCRGLATECFTCNRNRICGKKKNRCGSFWLTNSLLRTYVFMIRLSEWICRIWFTLLLCGVSRNGSGGFEGRLPPGERRRRSGSR